MSEQLRHRVNVVVTGRYRLAVCADCAWLVRGLAAERAYEYAKHHEAHPEDPAPTAWLSERRGRLV